MEERIGCDFVDIRNHLLDGAYQSTWREIR